MATNVAALANAAVVPAALVPPKYLDIPVVVQEETNWCWAAVTTAVARLLDPSFTLSQCEVAGRILGLDDCCPPGNNPAANVVVRIDDALTRAGGPGRSYYRGPSPTSLPDYFLHEVVPEINDGTPLVAQIDWGLGGDLHLVVICGYEIRNTGHFVEVFDPLLPDGGIQVVWPFDTFLTEYRQPDRPEMGRVVRVFRTLKPLA
jgi:hypothetical protein